MKHTSTIENRNHLATPLDEVTLEDVQRWQALAAHTLYPETRRICLRLIADYYAQHPEQAPDKRHA